MTGRWRRRRDPRVGPGLRDPSEETLPGMGSVVGIALVLAALPAAVYWPNAADGLLRLVLIALAIGYIGRRGFDAMPPLAEERGSPFGREPLPAPRTTPPRALYDLVRQFQQTAPPASSRERTVPPRICRILREEAGRRLSEGHRLDFENASHHPRIRALVAESTWRLLAAPATGAAHLRLIPLSQLDSILDDLERL